MGFVAFVYMLRCRDGSYYVGSARGDWDALNRRVDEPNAGVYPGYTKSRRPIVLVYHQEFQRVTDGLAACAELRGASAGWQDVNIVWRYSVPIV